MLIEPGQVWMGDKDFPYQNCYKGEMAYIVCSKEPSQDYWVCMNFQEWDFGAFKVEFNDEEINKMKYIGHIKDLKSLLNEDKTVEEQPTIKQ